MYLCVDEVMSFDEVQCVDEVMSFDEVQCVDEVLCECKTIVNSQSK
jgi:hypothetical protein